MNHHVRPLVLTMLAFLCACDATATYIGERTRIVAETTSTDGQGGTGGAGGVCSPGATQPCYTGPAGTEGQGICKGGLQTCAPDGASWGACTGEVLPQPENCATPLDEDCDGMAPSCKGSLGWAKGFGQPGDQYGISVAVDVNGDGLVAGYFSGALDFGGTPLTNAGPPDAFVARLSSSGAHVWSKQFGDMGDQRATGIAVDSAGDAVIVGSYYGSVDFGGGALTSAGNSDIFVAKIDANGNHLWSKRFGDVSSQYGTAVSVDSAGNTVITGYFYGSVDFGGGSLTSAGGDDIFVAKFDANGNHLWSERLGGTGMESGKAVAVDNAGNVFVTGGLGGEADLGGGLLASAGGQDAFIIKLDGNGNHLWSRRFGDGQDQVGNGIAVDASTGSAVFTGSFAGSVSFGGGALASAGGQDVFVAKLDANGNHMWSKRFGNGQDQVGRTVAIDGGGNVVFTGNMAGAADFGGGPLASAGGQDAFVVKLDASGNHLWSKRFGDGQDQVGDGVAVSGSTGKITVTGYFYGSVDFGAGALSSTGGIDVFIAAFDP